MGSWPQHPPSTITVLTHSHFLYQRGKIAMDGLVTCVDREKQVGRLEQLRDPSGLGKLVRILSTDLYGRLQRHKT
jgi:hypothetical protein